MARRTCSADQCSSLIPEKKRDDAKFCSPKCRKRMANRRYEARKADPNKPRRSDAGLPGDYSQVFKEAHETSDGRETGRKGHYYTKALALGEDYIEDLLSGRTTHDQFAADLGCSRSHATKVAIALRDRDDVATSREGWEQAEDVTAAVHGGYAEFAAKFHPHILVPDTHLEWETHIDQVVAKGGRLLLLAPQRHGKTEMLTRYCQRRIAADPNICILWVSRTKELAEESVGFVREMLEDERFAMDVLGPGESFVPPPRSGKSWTNEKFTVAQREQVRKSPTMRAMGIGGTTSGRDADLIIIDDPQEVEDCDSPTTSAKQSKWFWTTFLARKMEHTGIAFITSRKAPNDIPGEIIDKATDPGDYDHWRVVRYQAHDESCTIPESDVEAHTKCVLIPKLRGFKFLMGQKGNTPMTERFFETNYQNNPTTERYTLLTKDDVEAARADVTPGMHGPGVWLVAGYDPAPSKPGAGVLWAVAKDHAQIVDAAYFSAGPDGFNECLDKWFHQYGCRSFVLEENIAKSYENHPTVKATIANFSLDVKTHHTDHVNKNVGTASVVSMIQTIRGEDRLIRFPQRGNDIIEDLVAQLLAHDPNRDSKHKKDDLVMAMWVAWFKRIHDRLVRSPEQKVEVGYATTFYKTSNYMAGV